MAIEITNENFEQEVLKSTQPVIVDVYAIWCGPCQQMAPIFEELGKELGSLYKFAKLNVDDARAISVKLGVTSVPTFIFFKNGVVHGKETGYMSKQALHEKIKSIFG